MRLTNYWIVHVWIGAVFIVAAGGVEAAPKTADFRTILPGLGYRNDQFDDPIWSIHVARIDLARTNIGWTTVFGQGSSLGLRPMSRQIRTVPRLLGKPIAAINGDFYKTENESYPGDPRGLLICRGELISVPNANTCAWFAEDGRPHQGMVENLLHVKWADGEVDSVGLNEACEDSQPVLYSPAVGESTGTSGCVDLVLELNEKMPALPLRLGLQLNGTVKKIVKGGNASLSDKGLVLAVPRKFSARLAKAPVGAIVQIGVDTKPSLKGVQTAVGGGPSLVLNGKAQKVKANKSGERHPRSALGWNDQFLYLIVVDGRQPSLSIGMTLAEVANYLVKLGCTDGVNLDGGGSTELWVNGKIMNSPCYGHERETASCLVALQRTAEELPPK